MAKTSSRRPTPSRTKASAAKKPPSRSAGKEVLIGFVVVLGGLLLFLAVRSSDEPPDQLDGGTAGVTGPDFHSLVADPTTPGRLYVGGHQAVSESTDGGKTWTRVPSLDDAQRGVAESTDGGRTWTVLDSGLPAATWLSRRGDSLELLIASGPAGAARSTDGGRSWTRLDVPAGASLVEIAPEDPEVLYAGTHEGSAVRVQVSRDGGRTWAPA